MEQEKKNIEQQLLYETRSEEVQEIMGRMPSWLTRWGITVIGCIIIGMVISSNFIKYPDKIDARVSISSDNPPVRIISPSTARIQRMLVTQNDTVSPDKVLVVLENMAKIEDVLSVKLMCIDALTTGVYKLVTKRQFKLGELQAVYTDLITAAEELGYEENNDISFLSIGQIEKQMQQNKELISQMQNSEYKLYQNYLIDKRSHEADSILFSEKMMTEADYMQSKKRWIETQASLLDHRNNIIANTIKQSEYNKNILEIRNDKSKRQYQNNSRIEQSLKKLIATIEQWEQKYVIKSPIAGRVNLYSVWKENQYVKGGESILIVVPPVQHVEARGLLPLQNSGRIKVGQRIMINLVSHPSNEFGYIKGKVSYVSSAPLDSVYSFDISLDNGLVTTNKKVIVQQPQMYGSAEIYTDDKTLLQRLMEKFLNNKN